jgi:hypothetical protein
MFKKLVNAANELDAIGLKKEADLLDKLMGLIKGKLDLMDGLEIEDEEEDSEPAEDDERESNDNESGEVSMHKDSDGNAFFSGKVSTSGDMEDFVEKIKQLQDEIDDKIKEFIGDEECDIVETSSLLTYQTSVECKAK